MVVSSLINYKMSGCEKMSGCDKKAIFLVMSSRVIVGGVKRDRSPTGAQPYNVAATRQLLGYVNGMAPQNFSMETIIHLIDVRRADPNVKDISNRTAIMKICMLCTRMVGGEFHDKLLGAFKFLLGREDICVNEADRLGDWPIHHAAFMADSKFLKVLLEHRSAREGINALNDRAGLAPLHSACSNDFVPVKIIEYLLRAGANPNIRCGRFGKTPLHYVLQTYGGYAQYGDKLVLILQAFFQNPDTVLGNPGFRDNLGKTLLHYAVEHVRLRAVIDMLLEWGENQSLFVLDNMNYTPIRSAVQRGHAEAVAAFRNYATRKFRRGEFHLAG